MPDEEVGASRCPLQALTFVKAAAATSAPTLPAAAEMPWKKERTLVG